MNPDQLGAFVPLLLIAVVFWFLIMRPARKRQQQAQQLQRSLGLGGQVMLTSGIFGRVTRLETETLELEIAPGVLVTVLRQAVARVVEADDGSKGADSGSDAGQAAARPAAGDRSVGGDAPA